MTRRNASAVPRRDPKSNTWGFVVDVDDGPDGTRRQARRRGFPTKRTAQQELDRIRASVANQTYIAPRRQTFAEYIREDWLPVVKLNRKPSTYESYERNLRVHVLPRIGGLQLSDIRPDLLDRMYAELRNSGHRGHNRGSELSIRSTRYVHTIIRKALEDAVRKGRLVRNPADAADPPTARRVKKAAKDSMCTWSTSELEDFLRRSEGNRYQPAWLFLATTGCRRGEAVGLRWCDVDIDRGTVSIRQTITAISHRIHVDLGTKTDDGRTLELDTRTVAALKGWKARQAHEKLLMGRGYRDGDLVFCHPDGRPYHPERFSREFDRMVERLGCRRITVHDLRHTWATLALKAGVQLKVVSERLGHATTAVTADIYSHVLPGMQSDAAETVAKLIFGI